MKKLTIYVILATLCLNFGASGQNKPPIKITGTVQDSKGNALAGATVMLKGSPIKTVTDEKGHFILSTTGIKNKLLISYLSFEPVEISFNQKTNPGPFNVSLNDKESSLKEIEIVSTGYQNIPKERATGSFSQPIKEMLEARVSTDVISKLSGITSGLLFNSNTRNTTTGNIDINIRGRSTIFANDQPLVVVDNFPYSGDISNINPNDVLDITILKDAAAASIWGVRAGNGVIVITTKQGKLNAPLKVGFNTNVTINNKPDLNYNPNQLDSKDFIELEQYLFSKGHYDSFLNDDTNYPGISPVVELLALQRLGNITLDQMNIKLNSLKSYNIKSQIEKHFYQKAINQQYAINLSGGTEKATYFFSSGFDRNISNLKGNTLQRMTINSHNTFKVLSNLELSVGLNVVQGLIKRNNTLSNTTNHLLPYTELTNSDGLPIPIPYTYRDGFIQSAPSKGLLDWSYNPLEELLNKNDVVNNSTYRLSTGIKYSFLRGFNFDFKYQYEKNTNRERNLQNRDSYYTRDLINQFSVLASDMVTGYNVPVGDILNYQNGNFNTNNLRAQINYDRTFGKHSLTALFGSEFNETISENNSSVLYGYNDKIATFGNINPVDPFDTYPSGKKNINSGLGIGGTTDRFRSTFANAAYTFNENYTISASGRVDGSNYFGVSTNQKYVPLWSVGAKWNIFKENFYKSEFLPLLDFRLSYGFNGNLDRTVTGVNTFQFFNDRFYYNLPYAFISNLGNPDLKWEKTAITNIGIDFGSKSNIFFGTLDFFFKRGTDVLGYKNFATNSGIPTLKGNYADMSGQGFDFSLTTRILNKRVKWSTVFLLSFARDKVTRYDIPAIPSSIVASNGSTSESIPVVGKPVYSLFSYKWGGLNSETGNPVGYFDSNKSEDYSTISSRTPIGELVYSGPARPVYYGGINNRFSYQGFSLDIQINYKLGYYFRKPSINYSNITATGANLRVNKDYAKRWIKAGDEKTTNVPSQIYPSTYQRDNFYQFSEVNIEKGDHIRLQDISLSYAFNRKNFSKLPFQKVQIYMYCNNVGILWRSNNQGIDPDAVAGYSDFSTSTAPSSFSMGIKGSF